MKRPRGGSEQRHSCLKLGCQTIAWGLGIRDRDHLRRILGIIRAAGFRGVEFSQAVDRLGVDTIEELVHVVETEFGLKLLGLAGGSLPDRIAFCGDYRELYLYVDELNTPDGIRALKLGFTLAVHPHAFRPARSYDLARHFARDLRTAAGATGRVFCLLDSAHLFILGNDALEEIRREVQGSLPPDAVHIKDWTYDFGRSSHRYARGFKELGRGLVQPERILAALEEARYEGWVVIEIDRASSDPATGVWECARWLAARGYLAPLPPRAGPAPADERWYRPAERAFDTEKESRFLGQVGLARTQPWPHAYETIARAFKHLLGATVATVWACSPAEALMTFQASDPPVELAHWSLDSKHTLSGITVERQRVLAFDLKEAAAAGPLAFPELIEQHALVQMISIPIFNTYNSNHVRYIVNLLFSAEDRMELTDPLARHLLCLGEDAALAADAVLEARCSDVAAAAHSLADTSRTRGEYLQHLTRLMEVSLDAEAVAVFLLDDLRTRLYLEKARPVSARSPEDTQGATRWRVPPEERFYGYGVGLPGRCWEEGRTLIVTELPEDERSEEVVPGGRCRSLLLNPLWNRQARIVGVVRCTNKQSTGPQAHSAVFSDDDAAVLEAIAQAAIQHLEFFQQRERRAAADERLFHILKNPVAAIRAEIDALRPADELAMLSGAALEGVEEMTVAASRMVHLLQQVSDLAAGTPPQELLIPRATDGVEDLLAPAVRQVASLLRDRGLSPADVQYEGCRCLPLLYVDRDQMLLVVTNLLSNAIKFHIGVDRPFRVEVGGRVRPDGVELSFRDWGPGIPEGLEQKIFREGVRVPHVVIQRVPGQGLGLSIVRRLVELHGGSVSLTRHADPTEFTIRLPAHRVVSPTQVEPGTPS